MRTKCLCHFPVVTSDRKEGVRRQKEEVEEGGAKGKKERTEGGREGWMERRERRTDSSKIVP